ncbi:MMPL family transporter [Nocardia callitridis]|uniref:Membrane transport protein MMPL domain-containing protein n=1 Tax=Nocardia callitridis TaxID=648753 RepID=A0ABP9K6T6_9NOCA
MFAQFARWGDRVVRWRFAVIGVLVAGLLGLGSYGLGLGAHLSADGWADPNSESAQALAIKDAAYGRDRTADVVVVYNAPDGKTVDDPEFGRAIVEHLDSLPRVYPDEIAKVNGAYWQTETGVAQPSLFATTDKKHAFASVAIAGEDNTHAARNFRKVKDAFAIPGIDTQVAGGQAVAGALSDSMVEDQQRMELIAIPAVAVLLFILFGGLVAAVLPLFIGALTVLGAWGIVRVLTHFTEVNTFVSPVVSMIGLGLAIDYGLFIVSRFREELDGGHDVAAAVRRSVLTAGRTVLYSAIIVIAATGAILVFPQGFLKSFAFGTIATVALAALSALTILPALLAVLGRRVDMLGFARLRAGRADTRIEDGFWGRSAGWVMKHPRAVAIALLLGLIVLMFPAHNLSFGNITERYLPPDNPTRLAQERFDELFPLRKSDPIQLVMISDDTDAVGAIRTVANSAPGLAGEFDVPSGAPLRADVFSIDAALVDNKNADATIDYLRSIDVPEGTTLLVGGPPAVQKDSIDALLRLMPWMLSLVLAVTSALLVLMFGSLVLPLKAALMNVLGLGATLGILTWIFIDGHGAGLLGFTPQPIMSLTLVLITAIIYGLSTDYEVFLLARMVEARGRGASTEDAVRIGTAQSGRIVTAAAVILLVVTGAFAFSDLVMMQYIAYGMIAALFIDATILRMLLVPAVMALLGDRCWWAPSWLRRGHRRFGLGESPLDEPGGSTAATRSKVPVS